MSAEEPPSAPTLGELLVRHRADLVRFVERQAGSLLRFESAEDLAQAVSVRALDSADKFEFRGEPAFFGWIHLVARQVLADRHAHWSTLKRGSGKVLRMTLSAASSDPGAAQAPASERTGAATLAERREQLVLVAKALALLPERDRKLVQWHGEGIPIAEQAERLAIGYGAAQQAGARAMERFRKTFELLGKGSTPKGRPQPT